MGTGSSSSSTSNILSNKSKKSERYSVLPTNSSNMNASATTLVPECSPTPAPESSFRRSFRSLLQANSFDNPIQTQMFVLGMPRPSDIAPSVQQMSHSSKKVHVRNASTGKPCRTPSTDLLNSSRSPKQGDATQELANNESILPLDDRYYNATPAMNFLQNGRRHSIGAYFSRKPSNVSRNEPQIEEETSFCNDSSRLNFKFSENLISTAKKAETNTNRKKCCCCQVQKGKVLLLMASFTCR